MSLEGQKKFSEAKEIFLRTYRWKIANNVAINKFYWTLLHLGILCKFEGNNKAAKKSFKEAIKTTEDPEKKARLYKRIGDLSLGV